MGQRAKSLRLTQSRRLEWHEHDLPSVDGHKVLIKTIACAVSIGSEVPVYRGDSISIGLSNHPKQMGYESYGEVIDIGGDVHRVQIGDRVVAFYGQQDFAVCDEAKVIPVPKNIEPSIALLTILSCDAAKGVIKVKPNSSDRVLVTGLGTMGLLTVYFLREYMKVSHVDAIEPDERRRVMGMTFGVRQPFSDVRYLAQEYNVGFECSARNDAFKVLQTSMVRDGRVCILSDGNHEEFSLHQDFFVKELNIVGSSDGWDYHEHAKWFFKHVPNTPYITDLFQLQIGHDAIIQCFEDLAMGHIHPIKILVNY